MTTWSYGGGTCAAAADASAAVSSRATEHIRALRRFAWGRALELPLRQLRCVASKKFPRSVREDHTVPGVRRKRLVRPCRLRRSIDGRVLARSSVQIAQGAEQFARGARRLVRGALVVGLAGELAQVLAIGVRKCCQKFGQGVIALDDQAIAPGFDLMQPCRFVARAIAMVLEGGADRVEFRVVEFAHLLGDILGLPLVRDLLVYLARAPHLVAEVGGHRDSQELRIGQFAERLGEPQDIERLAPALAAADFQRVVARVGGSRLAIGFVRARTHIVDNVT